MPAAKSTRRKNFGSPKNDELEPLVFELYEEEYTAYPEIQGAKLLRFSSLVGGDDQSASSEALLDFFKTTLKPESYERMEQLWDDPERIVPIETLSDIIAWLVEEYTERPTQASKDS